MTNNLQTLKAGTVLRSPEREYTIVKVLGQGGFGITYLVEGLVQAGNISFTGKFALKEHFISSMSERVGDTVKVVGSNAALVGNSLKAFVSEATRLQKLGIEHPNIVKVNEVFKANDTAYYVMEYLEGENLDAYVRRVGALSEDETLKFMQPIVHAAANLHVNLLAHYDIKPQNIVLKKDEKNNGLLIPTLIDFGLAKHYDKDGNATSTNNLKGYSDGYAPSEQYFGITKFSPFSDVYALAATIYFCLTGKRPDKADEIDLGAVKQELESKLSPANCAAILKALSFRSKDRQQTAGELYAALYGEAPAVEEVKIKPQKEKKEENQKKTKLVDEKSSPKPWGKIAAIAAAVILLIVAIPFLMPKGEEVEPEEEIIIEEETTGIIDGHEWVNLGLPSGLKWATCNVGASSSSDYGNYYAWGETSTKSSYDSDNSKTYGKTYGDIGRSSSTDAAKANWGSSWRLPTKAEFDELIKNCTWTWTSQGGHNGCKVTSKKNGNSIFLPAAGCRNGSSSSSVGSDGVYLSSTPYESGTDIAYRLDFNSSNQYVDWGTRYLGFSVRPVSE